MFQPSHFQKMAQHLGVDSLTYEKEYNAFMTKLKNFHESKGTPFRRLPWLGGQYLDLYLLYRKVTLAGGWVKVTEGKTWRDIAEVFNLPPTCTNAAFALRQHYSRYLESFERINFFGEDAEDVLSAGRPHTPVGGGSFSTHIPTVAAADYVSVISTSKDPSRNFDKLVLSLQCGMPNEVDFAINICMLLSNVSNSVFNLSKAPAVIDTLLAHTGIFSEDSHGLKELYEDWYLKQHMERDFVKFWKDNLKVEGVREILCSKNDEGPNATDVEALFHPVRRKVGAKDVECQRISQVGMILYNFSFDDTNASVLASHPLCLRFLIQCICSEHGFLQRMAWETLSNLAEKMLLEPIESSNTQMFFQMLHFFLDHKDRYHVTNAMDVLGKLCTLEGNDEVIEGGLEPEAYQSLIKVLIVSDVQLVLSSLESLYNLSGVGQVTSDHIAEVHHSIDVLVCLVTMDAECFGPEALSEVQILEKRVPAAVQPAMQAAMPSPGTPKPQSSPMPVVPQQPKEPVVQHQAPPSSPSPGPIRSPSPSPVPIKTTGTEIEPETFTYNWLQGTYESCPGSSVSRIDIYADYLSSCSKLARIGILNATAFNRIIKLAFPDGQLRRVQSGDNAQYVLAGIKRRANPLPVETRTDSPATARQPSTASPHSAGHRVSPGQQSISRAPTLPVQSQLQPAWNPRQQNAVAAQPTPVQSMTRTVEQRPSQFAGGSQQQQQHQPGMVRVPRRPSFSNQGNMPTTPDQGIRQYPAATIQQQVSQTATDSRQMMVGQMQRTIVATGNEQPLERITAMRRASVEGVNPLPGQSTQSIQYQSQGQAVQRTSLPSPSPGPLRDEKQQTTYPAQGIQPQTVAMLPGQRMVLPGAQLMAKPPQGATVGMTGNGRPPQNPLSRSPLVPPRPIQPSTAQPAQTTPPTSSVRRPSLAAEPPAGYQQSPPPYPQQHNIRPAPPAYNSRPTFYGNYPPLAPKPSPEMNVQLSQHYQARKQIPPNTVAIGRHARPVPSSPLQQSDAGRQNFQPQVPPLNIARSPLVPPNLASGQPFSRSQQDVHGGLTQTAVGQDSRQSTRRPEGVVLIAQEERAADVVSSGLLDGAEEQQIVVVENKNRTNHSVYSETARITHDIPTNQVDIAQHSRGELFASNASNPQKPQGSHPSSNGSLKRDLNAHMMHDTVEENLNGRRDNSIGGDCGPAKRPRLEKRMSSLENELDNSTSVPSRTGSPTHLVNGDIKGDPRNKLMDKLLDKDLRLPLNGVCGIDASDLDLLASDGERLSGSKASSPDLFGSETNSDFGKYLEESDTDTGLFSDVLQGDLRIDPMENGTEGTHPVQSSKMPTFTEAPFHDSGNVLNVKGASSAVTEQQGKIPIPSSVRSDTQRLHEGAVNVAISRNPSAVNSTWNATNTVSQTSKLGYVNQRLAPDVHQRLPGYSQQGLAPQHVGIRPHLDNMSSTESQGTTVASQKRVFQHQNIQSNPQRVRTAQEPPAVMNRSGVLQNTLPGSHGPSTINSIAPGIQGSGVQQPLSVRPPFQGAPSIQTSLPRVNADSSGGIQSVAWTQSGVQQQLGLMERNQQRVGQVVLQQNAVSGAQVPSGPPNVALPSGYQQKTVNVYPDIRTQISATPASVMYDTTSASQSRQQPSQYQQTVQPGVQNPVPAASNPVIAGSQEFPSTPPAKGHLSDSIVPPVMSFKPFRCRWATCFSSFDTSKDLFSHVVKEHVPRDSLVLSCMWEGCPPVRRSRSSLLFHLQQKHSEPSPVPSTLPPQASPSQHQPPAVQPPPQPQAPPPNQKTTFVPAYHFLARMLQSFQGEEETPLTKTVRLTAALVLRNVAQYSALARRDGLLKSLRSYGMIQIRISDPSMLRRHESHLSIVAMSNSEAAHAVAACLSELSPHRKASSSDSNTFIWALER